MTTTNNKLIRNKRRNKIRIHREGVSPLITCGLCGAVVCGAAWYFMDYLGFVSYIIFAVSAILYGILYNF